MANDMVTRCARALDPFLSGVHAFDAGPPEYRAKCREAARAALEAMREPITTAMVDAGIAAMGASLAKGHSRQQRQVEGWVAMISAALSQEDRE